MERWLLDEEMHVRKAEDVESDGGDGYEMKRSVRSGGNWCEEPCTVPAARVVLIYV